MATKTNLEQAVRKQVSSLNDAQREIVLSQFGVYKQNKDRLSEIRSQLSVLSSKPPATMDEVRFVQSQRAALVYEQSQLSTANSKIAADLFEQLKEDR